MLFNTLTISSLLVASALAAAEPAPYQLGKISLNQAFGLMRRQAGYQPTQTYCGPGADCASSCGTGYVQCPSSDGDLHCYDPAIQQTCCPDGTGNSCDEGYYCTTDSSGNTWCCPDGLSLSACAAAYSLTGVLISETATSPPTSTSSSPATVTASPSTSGTTTTTVNSLTTTSSSSSSSTVIFSTPHSNLTATKTTSSGSVQFTGGANVQAGLAGFPALALAAVGAVFAL